MDEDAAVGDDRELNPSPTFARQTAFGASFHGATFSAVPLSRRGPSHCGQSAAGPRRTRQARAAGASQGVHRGVPGG